MLWLSWLICNASKNKIHEVINQYGKCYQALGKIELSIMSFQNYKSHFDNRGRYVLVVFFRNLNNYLPERLSWISEYV
jgi:hypothetical protein